MSKREKHEAAIKSILDSSEVLAGKFYVDSVTEDKFFGTFTVVLNSVYETTIAYAALDELSRLLGTKKIDVRARSRVTGYCESCAGTEEYVEISAYEVPIS